MATLPPARPPTPGMAEAAAATKPEASQGAARVQYITRLPSSALLPHTVSSSFVNTVTTAHIRIIEGAKAKVLQVIKEKAAHMPTGWAVLQANDKSNRWVIIQTNQGSDSMPSTQPSTPSTSPSKSDRHFNLVGGSDALLNLLNAVSAYLVEPGSVSRHRVMAGGAGCADWCSASVVELESFKVKPGRGGDLEALAKSESCMPSELSTDASFELQQDMADSQLFCAVYLSRNAAVHAAVRNDPCWMRWKRSLSVLLLGNSNRTTFTCVYESSSATINIPPTPTAYVAAKTVDSHIVTGDGTDVIASDSKLEPHAQALKDRFAQYQEFKTDLCSAVAGCTSLASFVESYRHFGFSKEAAGWRYRDWLPNVTKAELIGTFNDWGARPCLLVKETESNYGPDMYSVLIPAGATAPTHMSKYKLRVTLPDGTVADRVSPWANYATLSDSNGLYDGVVWDPPVSYKFKHPRRPVGASPKIYEAHIGVSSSVEKVSTYDEARRTLLPRVQRLGYDTILLVGVQEHAYYASFGWHVTSYYAPTSRCGSPDDLKAFVDDCHGRGLAVVLSVVYSHSAPSEADGLLHLDSKETPGCYFRTKGAGTHPEWDAPIFDYNNPNVLRFLLGNMHYYRTEYCVDGLRLEGVTSMLYQHHGVNQDLQVAAVDYSSFFSYDIDQEATRFLMMANESLHDASGDFSTIANEKSMFATLCDPVCKGGVGFDFTMSNHVPGQWIQMLLDGEEELSVQKLVCVFESRRLHDKCIAFTERYDTLLRGRRPLKIAMFAWESLLTHAVGGVAPHVTELAAGLARLGHEVHVFVRTTGSGNSHSVHYGVHYHECAFDLSGDFVGEVMNMCNSFVREMHSSESFMKERFSICHAHDWLASKTIASLATEGRILVQTMHSTEFGRCGNHAYGGVSKRIHDIEAEGCAVASRIICVSGVLAEEVTRLYGVHPAKIKVVYNGINAGHFDTREDAAMTKAQYGFGAMDPLFLFVGRMVVQKGPDLLIEAIPHVLKCRADAKFIIVGDGHLLDSLQKHTGQLGIGHACKLIGKCTGAPLLSLFKAADAVVVPSRNEPFGIVVLEAWAAHKPVVATTCGGPRDFVSHDVDGYLVDPTPDSISWGLCKILENFDHARWMGSRGRVKAAFSFSWDTIANQTRDLYNEQLARGDAAYCESARGDSSLSSRILGSSIFDNMNVFDQNDTVTRGLAVHKMMRLFTCGMGGNGYMNTMGTEFGQPEFVDLPRACNNHSYHHARTRWDLADNKHLKFKHFEFFDACMIHLEAKLKWMTNTHQYVCTASDDDKVVAFERGPYLFVFNFHPHQSLEGFKVGHSLSARDFTIALHTDESSYGGYSRLTTNSEQHVVFPHLDEERHGRTGCIKLYLPSQCGMVLASSQTLKTVGLPPVMSLTPDEYIDSLKC